MCVPPNHISSPFILNLEVIKHASIECQSGSQRVFFIIKNPATGMGLSIALPKISMAGGK